MSALAIQLKNNGYYVQGSDIKPTEITKNLEKLGIKIFYGQKRTNIKNCNEIVVSGAINENNLELNEALIQGLKIKTRAELLAEVSKNYKNVIAISGAHGKTSTTEMVAEIFIDAGLKPTVHIGGISCKFNNNILLGKKKFFICEACEYKNSFLNLRPSTSAILNVEAEHLDFFKTFSNVKKGFDKFESLSKTCFKVDKKRSLVYCKKFFVQAKNIYHLGNGKYGFDVFKNNQYIGKIYLNAVGKHNVLNSLVAISIALKYKVPFKKISQTLQNYKGVKRRYQIITEKPNFIVCDYAHHPTEIKKIIISTKRFRKGKIILAFQPHTYSRTATLFDNFVKSLSLADEVHIVKTYSAREKFFEKGSAKNLADSIKNSFYHSSMLNAFKNIKKHLKQGDTLLILGAGNIDELAEMFSI